MPNEPTENVYRDTEHRYLHDATFHAAVKMLESAAERHGFTPGELKQIAFKAALNLEMRARARPLMFISKGSESTLMELVPEEQRGHFVRVPDGDVAGYLKDGTPVFFGKAPT